MSCPDCGQSERFDIDGIGALTVTDDDIEARGALEWMEDAEVFCRECGWEGQVDELEPAFIAYCTAPDGLRDQAARADLVDTLVPFGAVAGAAASAARRPATGRGSREAAISVGGARGQVSVYLDGSAVDLTIRGLTPAQLLDALTAADTGALAAVVAALIATSAA